MVIDLDDDDEPQTLKSATEVAEFEDEDEEVDRSEPYEHMVRRIDIPLGTAARHLAVPHVPSYANEAPPGSYPPVYSSHIVVAVACNDLSVRLVVLPLTPPAPTTNVPSAWGVQMVKIGLHSHQDPISSVAITHTSPRTDLDEDVDRSKSRSRSGNRLAGTGAASSTSDGSPNWAFLVASTSPTAGGLLVVHQVPLSSDTLPSTSPESHILLQKQYIRSPLANAKIYFNTSPYPAERHSNILITCPDSGCVKIYQALTETTSTSSRGRRGSVITIESATSSSRSLRAPSNRQGTFLLTLYPGFVSSIESASLTRRKHVLDAAWVLGGRAVLVLLEGGEWGVWDIEGAGPTPSAARNLLKGQDNISGIQGGALTKFTLRGMITPPAEEFPKTQQSDKGDPKTGRLAPMTPHTRKVRSDGLFRGASFGSIPPNTNGTFTQGSICVTEHAPTRPSVSSTVMNESILLCYGNTNLVIPSLLSLWRAETTGKGSLDTTGVVRPSSFSALQLGGQQQRSIAALPHPAKPGSGEAFGLSDDKAPNVLITTEHRLIMLVTPISGLPHTSSKSPAVQKTSATDNVDQLLLT